MVDRRVLEDSVAEIEDVRALAERVKDARCRGPHLLPACKEGKRIEIALHRKAVWELAISP